MSQRRGADRAAYSQRNHSDDSTPPPPQPPNEQQQPAQPWTRGGRGRSRPWTRGGATTRGNSSSWGNQSRPAWGNDSTATGLPAPSWSTPPPASTSDSHVARGPDRLRPAPALRNVQHEFDALPLMSRMNEVGGRDDVERAKTRSVQESFYAYVLEQYKRLCEVPPSERKANHFDSLVAKLRKLREALTASDATDTFMRDVYELSVDVSLRARNFAEMLKALAALVGRMYDVLDGRDAQTFSPRRAEFTSFMLLYLCCYASGIRPLHPPAASSTAPKSSTSPARDLLQTYRKTPAPLQSHPRVLFAMGVARAVRADVDYVALAGYWERASWGELVFLEVRFLLCCISVGLCGCAVEFGRI
ncbi:uncharacterized protein EV422DRAFT_240327 [Fimicolochytrium jonesii]|uniref:uncharacterized protein n=1 Tax=Fimicolochytrium jonesii TaxID=1396493 RepID=UPI0022FED92E|nr:uncharacterized protein EV422DRAFT_240327 [Fimicolochytrium jonesii]KAI8824981.1 hypothetical protein EV422DRAFT_240327 [Fimicolochytrium jonesii]